MSNLGGECRKQTFAGAHSSMLRATPAELRTLRQAAGRGLDCESGLLSSRFCSSPCRSTDVPSCRHADTGAGPWLGDRGDRRGRTGRVEVGFMRRQQLSGPGMVWVFKTQSLAGAPECFDGSTSSLALTQLAGLLPQPLPLTAIR